MGNQPRGSAGPAGPAGQAQFEGIIDKPQLTLHQFGTHTLTDDRGQTLFALRSAGPVDLDRFVGKRVRISGEVVPQAPIAGGPVLMQVNDVKEVAPMP